MFIAIASAFWGVSENLKDRRKNTRHHPFSSGPGDGTRFSKKGFGQNLTNIANIHSTLWKKSENVINASLQHPG